MVGGDAADGRRAERCESRRRRTATGPRSGKAYPGHGGDLAKYLYPHVIAEEKKTNPNVVATEAWGWLPPPLHHEGEKVQTDWLHDFLMDPTQIRPAVVLRMPNFHMSSDEASKLVNYFAAKSNAEFPYEYNVRRRRGYLAELEQSHPALLNDAMKIVTDGNYCVKCHSVGDYQVKGAPKTLGSEFGPGLSPVAAGLCAALGRQSAAHLAVHRHAGQHTVRSEAAEFRRRGPGIVPRPEHRAARRRGRLADELRRVHARQTSVKGLVKEPAAGGQPPAGQPPATPPNNRSASK